MALLKTSSSGVNWHRRRLLAVWLALLAVLYCSSAPEMRAQNGPSREYQLKAVFLFNFAQFVDWPANAFADPNTPMVIGILGDDPFGGYLDATVRGEKENGHPLVVRRFEHLEDIKDCHILFISNSESKRMKDNLAALKGRNILTVGESDGFGHEGGMIRFVTEENKIRLHINLAAARAENLTISSRLLRLADIVGPEKN